MRDEWFDFCMDMADSPGDEWSGTRKIINNVVRQFEEIKPDLQLIDAGYTTHKMAALNRLYRVPESHEAAVSLWNRRLAQRKYGSVCFHCHNHITKSDPAKGSKRSSVMMPCIQSMSVTYHEGHTAEAHAYYRTTEVFKKFPADLVFIRDVLLAPFDFSLCPLTKITFFFANVTVHPMYYATLFEHMENPVREMEKLKKVDPRFHKEVVNWTSRYFDPYFHGGIIKYAQAMRVHEVLEQKITGKLRDDIAEYVVENHHRREERARALS